MKKQFSYLDILPLYEVYYKNVSLENFFEFMEFILQNNEKLQKLSEQLKQNYLVSFDDAKVLEENRFCFVMKYHTYFDVSENGDKKLNKLYPKLKRLVVLYLSQRIPELKILHENLLGACSSKKFKIADEFLDNYSYFKIEEISKEKTDLFYLSIQKLIA